MTKLVATLCAVGLLAGCGDDGGDDAATASTTTTAIPEAVSALKTSTLAIVGDVPYDDKQEESFPRLVRAINDDPGVNAVVHLGDIKGGQKCTDEFFEERRTLYDTFDDPFVYTPGDNEWTDCHRDQFGAYIPTERLVALRKVFYPEPEQALGGEPPLKVRPQSLDPKYPDYVENVMWTQSSVVLSTLHVVGSNNDLWTWFRDKETAEQTKLRTDEFDERLAADIAWLEATFEQAREQEAPGVVIAMQANMFVKSLFPDADVTGFQKLTQALAELSAAYDGEVLLLQGDTHEYISDKPLADGSADLGVTTKVPNLQRVVVQGETDSEWLRLHIEPDTATLFRWERVKL